MEALLLPYRSIWYTFLVYIKFSLFFCVSALFCPARGRISACSDLWVDLWRFTKNSSFRYLDDCMLFWYHGPLRHFFRQLQQALACASCRMLLKFLKIPRQESLEQMRAMRKLQLTSQLNYKRTSSVTWTKRRRRRSSCSPIANVLFPYVLTVFRNVKCECADDVVVVVVVAVIVVVAVVVIIVVAAARVDVAALTASGTWQLQETHRYRRRRRHRLSGWRSHAHRGGRGCW